MGRRKRKSHKEETEDFTQYISNPLRVDRVSNQHLSKIEKYK